MKFLEKFVERKPTIDRFYPIAKDRLALTNSSGSYHGVDEKQMCASFTITADRIDRVGDAVLASGCDLTNFKKNPIAFFSHQAWPLPIGVWEDRDGNLAIFPKGDHIDGTLYFSQRSKESAQIFALVAEGVLRATSIGFNPLSEPIHIRETGGYQYNDWELLEASVVGLPCQPLATLVRGYLSSGKIAGERISPHLRKSLEPLAEPVNAFMAWDHPLDKITKQQDWEIPTHWLDPGKLKVVKYEVIPMAKQMSETDSGQIGGYVSAALEDEGGEEARDENGKPIKRIGEEPDEGDEIPEGEEGPMAEKISHGKTIMGLAKLLPKQVKDALQECVSAKIPKIAADHPEMDPKQREAIAYSMCGEKGFKDMDATEDMVTKPEEGQGKAGAEYIKEYCALHGKHYGKQENEDLRDEMDHHKSVILKMAEEKYPEVAQETTGETNGPAAAADAANEAVKPYEKPPKTFTFGMTKNMKLRGMTVIREASDHLHEVSRLPGEGEVTKAHKKAFDTAHGHARALDALQGAMASETEQTQNKPGNEPLTHGENQGESAPSGQEGPTKELDLDRIMAAMESTSKKVDETSKLMQRVTGARNGGKA